MYSYSARGCLRACTAACLFERLKDCDCVRVCVCERDFKADSTFGSHFHFSGDCVGVEGIALKGPARRGGTLNVTDRSPRRRDHQTAFVTRVTARGGGAVLVHRKLEAVRQVRHFSGGCTQSLGRFKPPPVLGMNHYRTTHGHDRHTWSPLATLLSLFILLPLDDQVDPLQPDNTHRGLPL